MEEAPLKRRCSSSSSADDDDDAEMSMKEEDQPRNPSPDHHSASLPHHAQAATAGNKEIIYSSTTPMEAADSSRPSSTTKKQKEAELESTRAEMAEVMEENRRLKLYLEQIMKDYRSLQTKFHDIASQQQHDDHHHHQKSTDSVDNHHPSNEQAAPPSTDDDQQLISLSLGRSPSRELKRTSSTNMDLKLLDQSSSCLSLTLDCRFEGPNDSGKCGASSSNGTDRVGYGGHHEDQMPQSRVVMGSTSSLGSFEGRHGKEERETHNAGSPTQAPPNKATRSGGGDDEEALQQQNPAKKARVSVRARCDTPTMNDGCQWRKYGQKIAKGNPCPRAYYRCTVGPSCPVRKQVQRCADDMSILITTYEGNHNHPLPMSATTMASTTSAAASMLLSGSSSSSTPAAGHLHGLNMYISDNNNNPSSILSRPSSSRPPFYFHTTTNPYNNNSSSSPYSPSPAYPTITLDLTSHNMNSPPPPPPTTSSSSLASYARFSSRFAPASSLNFGDAASSEPATWGLNNNSNGILNYGIANFTATKNSSSSSSSTGPVTGAHYRMMTGAGAAGPSSLTHHHQHHQSMLADSTMVAAATKAITADPSFQSALAAALSSIIGNGNNSGTHVGHGTASYLMNMKTSSAAAAAASNNTTSSSSSLSRTGSLSHTNNQAAAAVVAGSGVMFQAPLSSSSSSSSPQSYSMPAFAAARDASSSPSDNN